MGRATGVFSRVTSAFFYLLNGELHTRFDKIITPTLQIGLTPYEFADMELQNQKQLTNAGDDGRGILINDNGTKLYVSDITNDVIYEWTLSTPWDLTSASYVQSSSIDSEPTQMAWGDDENTIFVLHNEQTLKKYTFGTAYDITTLTKQQSKGIASNWSTGFAFAKNGYKLYNNDYRDFKEWNLNVAYDLSTASDTGNTYEYYGDESDAQNLAITNDGSRIFLENNKGNIHEWEFGTSFDISTLSYVKKWSNPAHSGTVNCGLCLNSKATRLITFEGASTKTAYYFTFTSAIKYL